MAKVYIVLTIDWEGEHFDDLNALQNLRKKIGFDIPISNFVCPAYYFRKERAVTKKIKKIIGVNDELHLHLHCYKELIEASGLEFKKDNNYYRPINKSVQDFGDKYPLLKWLLPKVSGRGVPLSVYSAEEQEKILQFSLQVLKNEFPEHKLSGFRSGGNMVSDDTFDIIKKMGFLFDSSATAPAIFSKGFGESGRGSLLDDYGDETGIFTQYILKLWGGQLQEEKFMKNKKYVESFNGKPQEMDTQPFFIDGLLELPENCGMTDFVSPQKTAFPILERLIKKATQTGENQYFHYGCHNEGEAFYKGKLLEFIKLVENVSGNVEFTGIDTCRNIFGIRQ